MNYYTFFLIQHLHHNISFHFDYNNHQSKLTYDKSKNMKTNDHEIAEKWKKEPKNVKEYFKYLAEKGKLKEKERKKRSFPNPLS